MIFSPGQSKALLSIDKWLKDPNASQVFRLFGSAGTGKSTIIEEAVSGLSDVLYAAPTGKAALVLQEKGHDASTVHSLIYAPLGENTGRLDELNDQLSIAESTFAIAKLKDQIAEERRKLGNPSFALKDDSVLRYSNLLVIDEASMINEKMALDLMSFGTKILIIGDPFQLPPCKGTGYFTEAQPDAMLTEIHRQASESPIIRVARAIIEKKKIPYGVWDRGEQGKASRVSKADVDIGQFSQALTGMNKTRRSLNLLLRNTLGFSGLPSKGERLICLRNNHNLGLLNGMFAILNTDPIPDRYVDVMQADLTTEGGTTLYNVDILNAHFDAYTRPDAAEGMTYNERKIGEEFDFGNCVTVHRAQGSEFTSVLFYDDGFMKRDPALRRRLLYTACTRAVDEFCWAD